MFFSEADLYREFTQVYKKFEEIPFDLLQLNEINRKHNSYNFFQYGDLFEYIIQLFKKVQPKAYSYLIQGEFLYAIDKSDIPVRNDITQLAIVVNDRVYYIKYDPYSYSKEYYELYHAHIPIEILESWLYRSKSWVSAEYTIMNSDKSNLPSLSLTPLHSIIRGFDGKKGYALPKYTDFLETKFNHLFKQNYLTDEFIDRKKYFQLRCLLDTRLNEDWSESGYQLFISSHNNERNVYVVPRANVMGIKKLSNPAEAIDAYAAHLFARKEGEFDFMAYAEDF